MPSGPGPRSTGASWLRPRRRWPTPSSICPPRSGTVPEATPRSRGSTRASTTCERRRRRFPAPDGRAQPRATEQRGGVMRGNDVETRRDRAALAQDAGKRKVSFLSVLAGTLVAYGCFAVLAAVAAAVAKGTGFDTDLSGGEWRDLGIAGGAAIAAVQFVSYFFGGYVSGRMARRSGALNGFLVFFLGVVLAVGAAAVVTMFADTAEIQADLRNIGIPTSSDEWQQIGTFAGIGSL